MEGKSLTLIAMLKCHMEYMGNNTSTKSVLFVQLQEISLVFLMVILNNITINTICFHLMKLVNKIGVITHSGVYHSLIRTRMCAYQRVRKFSFLENFAYVLNEWCPYLCVLILYFFIILRCHMVYFWYCQTCHNSSAKSFSLKT